MPGESGESGGKSSASLYHYSVHGKGKVIFNQGEPITGYYFLCKGSVKLTKLREGGEEVIIDLLTPCSLLGEPPSVEGIVHGYSAVLLENEAEVTFLKPEGLASLIRSDPTMGLELTRHLLTRLREAYRLVELMKLPVEQRVLALLARLGLGGQEGVPKGAETIPLSQRELAQIAQTTPETLSRTLRALKAAGVIRLKKQWLEVVRKKP